MADAPSAARDAVAEDPVVERLAVWQVEAGDNIVNSWCISISRTIMKCLQLAAWDLLELRLRVSDLEGRPRGETRHRLVVTALMVGRPTLNIRLPSDEARRLAIKDGERLDILVRCIRPPRDPPPPPRTAIVYQKLLGDRPTPLTLAGPNIAGAAGFSGRQPDGS